MSTPLRVCVDARLRDGQAGGVQQVVIGLASGLSKLTDGDEEYLFFTYAEGGEWLRPYIDGPCRMLGGPHAEWRQWVESAIPGLRSAWHGVRALAGRHAVAVPKSDGTIERAGVDLIHFPFQWAFVTEIPSIYHPHDLQHLHLPEFFTAHERMIREVKYRAFCRQARMVAAASSWTKRDFVAHYDLPEEKVCVVPLAPMLMAYPCPSDADLTEARRKFSLPETYLFYPAQTWPHKNHVGLLEALALLRDHHGLDIVLVSSGILNHYLPRIERRARQLGLADRVRFLGFVSPLELQCLYHLCRCVAIPSKFEAASFPLWEAFLAGVPVACANVTSLPEQAGDAALIFDPDKTEEIAEAISRLWTDAALRKTLAERGRSRVAMFTWERTARIFRAHYRRIADRPLTEQDRALLAAPPLV